MFSCDCVGRDIGRIVSSTTTKAKAHQNVTAAAPCTLTGLLAGIIIAIVLNVQRFQYLTSRALLSKQLLSTFSYQGGGIHQVCTQPVYQRHAKNQSYVITSIIFSVNRERGLRGKVYPKTACVLDLHPFIHFTFATALHM